ncbi:MAG: hypothetical protein ACP5NS_03690 [Candidatus Pacearchaeota archaeon]
MPFILYPRKNRAQSSIEFIILVGVLAFFFLMFMLALQGNLDDAQSQQRDDLLQEVALTVQSEISLATSSIDGYSRNFTIPQSILGVPYNATIEDGWVYLNTIDNLHALSFPVSNVTGNVLRGVNVIRRANGAVYLNS